MAPVISFNLDAVAFDRAPREILNLDGFAVSAFRYASGVAALRVVTRVGEVILLPYQGQQIWDAQFHGRRLTMRSMFDEPVATGNYIENYGGFLLHCGATAMGNPGASDSHPLHGELPNALYQSATLEAGSDADGNYVALSGRYRHTVAFAHNYVAEPRLQIHAVHARMKLDFAVTNLKRDAMDVMYLAHVNFRPVDGARIVDTVPDDPRCFRIRNKVPEFFKPSATHAAFIAALETKPELHRIMDTGRAVDPELVMGLDFMSDTKGWAHAIQVLPDGSADFISHRPQELPRGVRWITRTANQDALGLFLPGTAEADGYTAEKAKGNMVRLEAGSKFTCSLAFGALEAAEAMVLQKACRDIVNGAGSV